MKKVLGVVVVALMVAGIASGAFAASVSVNANVQAKCGAMADGSFTAFNIDPDAGIISKVTSTDGTSPSVKCTKNSTINVTCPPTGTLTMAGDAGGDITFSVSCPGTYTASGFGTADDIPVTITFAAGAAQNSAAGVHTGSIVVTVLP